MKREYVLYGDDLKLFLWDVREVKADAWWAAKEVLEIGELPWYVAENKWPAMSLGQMMAARRNTWVYGLLVEGRSRGSSPFLWRLLDVDDVLAKVG